MSVLREFPFMRRLFSVRLFGCSAMTKKKRCEKTWPVDGVSRPLDRRESDSFIDHGPSRGKYL